MSVLLRKFVFFRNKAAAIGVLCLFLKGSFLFFLNTICFSGSVSYAQDAPVFDTGMLGMMMDQNQKKPKTEEEAMIFVESYFLEMMFLKPMFQSQPSMLSEEEKAEMGSFADTSMQDQLITRAMAERLAKQDVLGMRKLFKGHGRLDGDTSQVLTKKDNSRYMGGLTIGKVPH
jgi:hypothetical protein